MLQLQARQENDNHQNTFEFHQEGREIQTLSQPLKKGKCLEITRLRQLGSKQDHLR